MLPIDQPAQLVEMLRQISLEVAIRAAKHGDILTWGQALFPDKFPLDFCHELHGYFVEIRKDPFTDTEAPRGSSKTTVKCFLIPLFQALEEPLAFQHYLNVQATEEKALAVNRSIKLELETNGLLRDLYGSVMGNRWTDNQFVIRHKEKVARWGHTCPYDGAEVVFSAVSTGQSIRGINYRNWRPDYLIGDDLYNENDINNPDATEKKNDWILSTLLPARSKSRRTSVHLQGTAINLHDILARFAKNPRWRFASFQAIKDWESKTLLWPNAHNTWDSLMADKRDMGTLIFNREFQNIRADDSESKVKRSWLRYYDPRELAKKESRAYFFVERRFGNDPSVGNSKTKDGRPVDSDFNGLVQVDVYQWADGSGTDHYISRVSNERLSMVERINLLIRWAADCPPTRPVTKIRIEANAAFEDYAQEVIRKTNLPVEMVKQVKDKLTVLENKSHYFENGKVYISTDIEQDLREVLVQQLTTNFPKHDDVRDAALLTLDDQSASWAFVR